MKEYTLNPYAKKAIKFIENLTLIGDYSGQKWKLEPWQKDWIGELFGKRNEAGDRVIKKVSLWLPRGSGKTQMAAGIATYLLFCGPPGQELYAAAPDRDKAGRIHKAMAQMIRADPKLNGLVDISDHFLRIKYKDKSSVFQALPADSDQGHSLAPSTLILDELHLWKSRALYDALTSGFGKRKKGSRLEIQISTAGDKKSGLAWDLYTYAKNVQAGIINDPETLVRIFEADDKDDWTDPATWAKAMPFSYVDMDFIASQCELAKHIRHKMFAFKRLHLNIWCEDGSGETWISSEDWAKCKTTYTAEELAESQEPCTAALDLSSIRDLTSLSLFFPESKRTLSYSWIPGEGLAKREEEDGVPYRLWAKDGHLFPCTGSRIVHSEVADKVNEILQRFNVERLVADPYSLHLVAPLLNQEPETYSQSPGYMSPPTKWLESAISNQSIHYNGDPLLAWAVSNVVCEKDRYENLSPHKGKARKRCDPCIALIMAIGAWLGTQGEEPEQDINDFYSNKENWMVSLKEETNKDNDT